MSTPDRAPPPPTVSRTYRMAIRHGEDFITVEEVVTLPTDADDATIEQAVATGWRIYLAQHAAVQEQVAAIRATLESHDSPPNVRNPELPATERQRNLIAAYQQRLHWDREQLTRYADQHGVLLADLNRGQASELIDQLKQVAEAPAAYAVAEGVPPSPPATESQHNALRDLAQRRGVALATVVQQRFGTDPADLTEAQAAVLIRELNRRGDERASGS